MRKWREKLNLNNSASLNNGHADPDAIGAPVKPALNGDGSTNAVTTIGSKNGRTLTPIFNGPCNIHNDKVALAQTEGCKDGLKVVPYPGGEVDGEVDVPSEDETSDLCGIGAFKPQWIQPWANKNVFLAVFCLTSVLQGMYYTYFVSVLTTIEKLFQIQSKTTGIIMSATEMGQIGGALLLTYYGGQGHRPKWIACGMIVFAVASFLCSLPHFIFGGELSQNVLINGDMNNSELNKMNLCNDRTLRSSSSLGFVVGQHSPMSEEVARFASTNLSLTFDFNSSLFDNNVDHLDGYLSDNSSSSFVSSSSKMCENVDSEKHTKITKIVLTIFFISLLFIGIGATAVYTLGIPYIDDNVANRDSPLYFAITIGVRILGPVFGFLLGSFCTSLYVEPFETPIFSSKDPRWIGAWWLGLFIVAAALMVSSIAMFAFPKQLPTKKKPDFSACLANNSHMGHGTKYPVKSLKKPSLRDFPVALRRLLKNDILLCRTASSVLHILPIAGLYTFLPKFIESQFRMTATEANMVSGIAGILVMGVGIFASGMYMRRYKPNPRFVAGWIAMTALAYAIGMVILSFLGCPLDDFASQPGYLKGIGITSSCNSTCICDKDVLAPICTSEGVTYYSACHAGCSVHVVNKSGPETVEMFYNCSCLHPETTAKPGYCKLNCNSFVWYTCIFSIFVLIHSTSEVGSMLLTLRCVDPKDKAMALGLISFAIGLFGNVPCPIIYGAVVDSACLVWKTICGEKGACGLYDPELFRKFFHGMTGAVMFMAFIVDGVVWYKAKDISFLDDEKQKTSEETEPMNTVSAQSDTTV